ncbi:MAG: 50S ribosomal protein L18e [Candidatus Marsarchaeota archaeon]|jgi:large subunit ribosomal protein L18e|nr:50S ribosomal protein L18e [Candidatus Marsarchaeota archaeon]
MAEKESINAWIAAMSSVRHGDKNSGLARAVLKIVQKPRRRRVLVSISKLNRNTNENECVIVPGKVLSDGTPDKAYEVCAVEYSAAARRKLLDAGCKIVKLEDIIKREGVRILA